MLMKGEQVGLYRLVGETQVGEAVVSSAKVESPTVWHRRLGHTSERALQVLSNRELLLGYKSAPLNLCEDYIYGKKRRLSFSLYNIKEVRSISS